MNDKILHVNASTLREKLYPVDRGVIPGTYDCVVTDDGFQEGMARELIEGLESVMDEDSTVIAYAFVCEENRVFYGYAAEPWVVELLKFGRDEDKCPEEIMHMIQGMVAGYSPKAIENYLTRKKQGRQ